MPPDVRKMHDELVNLRAENELLRMQSSASSESRDRTEGDGRERDELRREVARLQTELVSLRQRQANDNRNAVIKRLTEEREELARALAQARERYEAEPPASRDPKTFEDRVLAILNRLVK